jgi:hypothetical protein
LFASAQLACDASNPNNSIGVVADPYHIVPATTKILPKFFIQTYFINLDFPKILAAIPNYSTIPKPMKISRTSKNGGFSIDAANNI